MTEHRQRRQKGDAGHTTFATQSASSTAYTTSAAVFRIFLRNPADAEVEGCRQAPWAWQRWGAGKSRKLQAEGRDSEEKPFTDSLGHDDSACERVRPARGERDAEEVTAVSQELRVYSLVPNEN
jgi:hypothetical protein